MIFGHVITKFSGMGRFIYPWCSAGALRARSSAMSPHFQAGWLVTKSSQPLILILL